MDDSTEQGQLYANQMSKVQTGGGKPMIDFPIYYPTRLAPGSTINEASRAFPIDGPDKEAYRGYKMVVDIPGIGARRTGAAARPHPHPATALGPQLAAGRGQARR
jgi:hypothetical protein